MSKCALLIETSSSVSAELVSWGKLIGGLKRYFSCGFVSNYPFYIALKTCGLLQLVLDTRLLACREPLVSNPNDISSKW